MRRLRLLKSWLRALAKFLLKPAEVNEYRVDGYVING